MNGNKPLDLVKNILNQKSPVNRTTTPQSSLPSHSVTPDVTEEGDGSFSERNWSKKMWKMYRMLIYLEKHKIDGAMKEFSSKIRDIATYFAVKYRL